MVERDSLRRGSVLASGAASPRARRSGLVSIILPALGLLTRTSAVPFPGRANADFRAIQKLVESIHSYHFLRLKALDGGHGSIRCACGNRPHGGGLVALNRVNISALGVALNRRSGDQSHVVLRIDE